MQPYLNTCRLIGVLALVLSVHTHADTGQGQTRESCDAVQWVGTSLVPERLLPAMQHLNQAYCADGGERPIQVTSGVRSAAKQAQLMRGCLAKQACGYYANQQAAAELQATYDAAKGDKLAAVTRTIEAQMARPEPCYISKHLTAYGLDLERWDNGRAAHCMADLSGDDLILSQVLQASAAVANVVYQEGNSCSHFHVNFVGWDQIPGLRRCQPPKKPE
ncbi:hypothetical protein [Marinicella meishanensis]|uniref:hypothetical protein n=1 Tax=Marinicella meishanensis TaxID=2873263 RepID=UPI001CBED487|nr:hypothetical protein [Marinicella sp. NBU2979]